MAKKPPEPEKPVIRDAMVKAYFTPQDAQFLQEFSNDLGMSRSGLIVAIMERMIIGGFSIRVAAQLTCQLQRRARERGADSFQGLYFGLRPLPPLPVEELTEEDKKLVLEELNKLK